MTPSEHALVFALREIEALGCRLLAELEPTSDALGPCPYPHQCPWSIAHEALMLWSTDAGPKLAAFLVLSPALERRIIDFADGDPAQIQLVHAVFDGTMIGLERARSPRRAKAATPVAKTGARGKGVTVGEVRARASRSSRK